MYTLFFLAVNAVTLGLECGFFFLLSPKKLKFVKNWQKLYSKKRERKAENR